MAGTQACVSAIPQAIDALVRLARANLTDGTSVYDGEAASDDPGNFLMIGVEDPDSQTMSLAAKSVQDWAGAGWQSAYTDEEGDITCAAVAWNGDNDQKAARDAAAAIAAALAKAMFADPTLGLGPWFQSRFGVDLNLSQLADSNGISALVVFQIHFAARIYRPS